MATKGKSNDAASDDVVLHGPDDDGLRISAMISFLYIACTEFLRVMGIMVICMLTCILACIECVVDSISWLLDKANGALRSAHDWLGS